MEAVGLSRYLDLLRAPGVWPLLLGSWTVRLSYGMNLLALILMLRAAELSYAEVGLVAGGAGLALGATAPTLGRLVDRVGQTRVLVATGTVALAGGAALLGAAVAGAGVVPLLALALVSGAATPPVSPCMRALWPRLVERERLDTAYAFDAIQLEFFFIVGPLLAAGIASAV